VTVTILLHAWADPRPVLRALRRKPTPRHSPTLVNRLFSETQQWAGTPRLARGPGPQGLRPVARLLVKNLGGIRDYQEQFRKVFAPS